MIDVLVDKIDVVSTAINNGLEYAYTSTWVSMFKL